MIVFGNTVIVDVIKMRSYRSTVGLYPKDMHPYAKGKFGHRQDTGKPLCEDAGGD